MPATQMPIKWAKDGGGRFSPITYTASIRNNDGTPIGGFAQEELFTEPFDPQASYAVDETCMYQDNMYKFTAVKSAGEWDPTKVQKITVASEFARVDGDISTINQNLAELLSFSGDRVSFTSSTTYSYTGKSVTIPARKTALIFVNALYANNKPLEVSLCTSATAASTEVVSGAVGHYGAHVCYLTKPNTTTTYYIWAKYDGVGSNMIDINYLLINA